MTNAMAVGTKEDAFIQLDFGLIPSSPKGLLGVHIFFSRIQVVEVVDSGRVYRMTVRTLASHVLHSLLLAGAYAL
jgi:hypothetical protein